MTKMIKAKLLFLGTGGSMGVPLIGCKCAVCTSSSPKNKRLRPSALLTLEDKRNILIDAGQDYRTQALRYGIDDLDGVIFTHAHYDHTAGIDDLRVYYIRDKAPLPCLLSAATADDIQSRFSYLFKDKGSPKLIPKFAFQILEGERGSTEFLGLKVGYMTFEQAKMAVNGFRFGNLAYVSDIRHYPETIFDDLKGVENLVVSALRFEKSPLHLSIEEAVAFAQRVEAKQAWFTHLAHEVEHDAANRLLPPNIQIAYDGLVIDFEAERGS